MFSNVVIMTLNYVLCPILVQNPENAYFEGVYIFPLHQHTATINSTIRQHSCYITSTQQTLKDGDLPRFGWSLWRRLWLWFKSSGFINLRKYTTVTKPLSGTYQKQFLLCSNRTTSWCRSHMYISTCFPPLYVVSKIGLITIT